jgi:hypothetical protein
MSGEALGLRTATFTEKSSVGRVALYFAVKKK